MDTTPGDGVDKTTRNESTTRGGVQRTKFAPNLEAAGRRTPRDTSTVEPVAVAGRCDASGRGRGVGGRDRGGSMRGRGEHDTGARPGSRLLSGGLDPVSGPFALGPSGLVGGVRGSAVRTNVGTIAPVRSSGNLARPPRSHEESSRRAAQGDEDDSLDIEKTLSSSGNRSLHEHFPITLLGMGASDDAGIKADPMAGTAEPSVRSHIADQEYVEGGNELLQPGRLMIWQLPGCIPVPLASEQSNKEDVMASLLTTGPTGSHEAEKTIDLAAFQAAQKLVQDSQPASGWPATADGLYGKVRIHASGRISLCLASGLPTSPSLYHAVSSSVRSDLTGIRRAVAIDAEYGQSFDLGSLDGQLVFVPELSQLIAAVDLFPQE